MVYYYLNQDLLLVQVRVLVQVILLQVTNYEIVYRLTDKVSPEHLNSIKDLAKVSLIILQIKNFYNITNVKLSTLIKKYLSDFTSEISNLYDLENKNIELIGEINNIISNPDFIAFLSDESSVITDDNIKDDIVKNITENVDDNIIYENVQEIRERKLRNRTIKYTVVINNIIDVSRKIKTKITDILNTIIPRRKTKMSVDPEPEPEPEPEPTSLKMLVDSELESTSGKYPTSLVSNRRRETRANPLRR